MNDTRRTDEANQGGFKKMAKFKCNVGDCKESFPRPMDLGRHKFFTHKVTGSSVTAKAKRSHKMPSVPVSVEDLVDGGAGLIQKSIVALRKEWHAVNSVITAMENLRRIQEEA